MPRQGSAACIYDKPSIDRSAPTGSGVYMDELVPDADRAARRRELILEFQSVCIPGQYL
jgi:hypothetical protein